MCQFLIGLALLHATTSAWQDQVQLGSGLPPHQQLCRGHTRSGVGRSAVLEKEPCQLGADASVSHLDDAFLEDSHRALSLAVGRRVVWRYPYVFNPVLSHEFLKFSAREVTPIVTDNSSRETMSGEYLPQLLYCRCGRGGLHCVHFEPLGVGVQTTRNM